MVANAGGVRVRILGDDSDLQGKLRSSINAVAKWSAAAAAGAAAAGLAITAASAEAAKELQNLTKIAGMNAVQFQRNALAAKTVGIEQDKLSDIYKDMNDRVGDFIQTGAGPMADFFEQIAPKVGVTAQQFKKLNGADALQLYVSSLEKANLSQADMTFYMEALASDSTALLPLLRNNGEAMQQLGDQAERLGVVLSEVELEQLAGANDSIDSMKQGLKSITDNLALQMSPFIEEVAELFVGATSETDGFADSIKTAFQWLTQGAAYGADAVRGIHAVVKALEVGFWGLQAGVLTIFSGISHSIDRLINGIKRDLNFLIDGINAIPFIDPVEKFDTTSSSKITQWFEQVGDAATGIMNEKVGELHELLMKPLPGESIIDWADRVQTESKRAAEAAVKEEKKIADQKQKTLEDLENSASQSAAIESAKNAQSVMSAKMMRQQIADVEQVADSEAIARAAETQQLISLQNSKIWNDSRKAREAQDAEHLGKLADQIADYNERNAETEVQQMSRLQQIREGFGKEQFDAASSMLGNLSALMQSENKKQFEVGKMAAKTQVAMSTITAAQEAYKAMAGIPIIGPALGVAAAGAAIVAGKMRLNQINSQQFGGGSISGGGGGGAGASIAAPAASGGQAQAQQNNVAISLHGDSFGRDTVLRLIDQINDAVSDGATVRVV